MFISEKIKDLIVSAGIPNTRYVNGQKQVTYGLEFKFLIDEDDNMLPTQKMFSEHQVCEKIRQKFSDKTVINRGNEYLQFRNHKRSYRSVLVEGFTDGEEALIKFYVANDAVDMLFNETILPD